MGHQLGLREQRGYCGYDSGCRQQQQLQAVDADQQAFQPEHDQAQPYGGRQGQRPADVQVLRPQHGLLQGHAVQGQRAQQAGSG